jgi:hypothetical protein
MTDLKPCPFCGQEPDSDELVEGTVVSCCDYDCVGSQISTSEVCWNTRADVPEQEQPSPAPAESGGMLPSGDASAALKALDWLAEMAEEAMHHHMQRDSVENAVADVKAGLIHHAERNAVEVVTVESAMQMVDYDYKGKHDAERGARYVLHNLAERFPSGLRIVKGGG